MKIFITGFMASGKTMLGKKLASLLHLPSFDLDTLIESAEKISITEIFKIHGEDYFRNLESEKLREIIKSRSSFVLSCGGGTSLKSENLKLMQDSGLIIFLDTPPDTIFQRLLAEKTKRPLVAEFSGEILQRKIQELLATRLPTYQKADITCSDKELIKLPQLIAEKYNDLIRIGRTSG